MRIIFSGTQGTGKTTIFNEVKKQLIPGKYELKVELVRDLMRQGLKINKDGDDVLQLSVFASHLNNLMKYDDLITDRGLLDACSYSKHSLGMQKVTECTHNLGEHMLETSVKNTDLVFYFPPGQFELVEDGVRDTDIDYINEVHENFLYYMDKYFQDTTVVTVTGSIKERTQLVIKEIEKKESQIHKEIQRKYRGE